MRPCGGLAVRCLQPGSASSPRAPRTGFEPVISAVTRRRPLRAGPTGPAPVPAGMGYSSRRSLPGCDRPRPAVCFPWTRPESNRPPPLCESGALPDELRARDSADSVSCGRRTRTSNLPVQSRACCQIAPARIRPADGVSPSLAGPVVVWSGYRDSNPGPRRWQRRALPAELQPHGTRAVDRVRTGGLGRTRTALCQGLSYDGVVPREGVEPPTDRS